MIAFKINLIVGLIKLIFDFIELVIKYLFRILNSLHLTALFLVVVIGVLLELLFNSLSGDATFLIIYSAFTGFALVRFIFKNFEKIVGKKISVKTENKAQPIEVPIEDNMHKKYEVIDIPAKTKVPKVIKQKPVYYRVAQNPKYIMAEYNDRYELFYDSLEGLKFIRTDYKQKGENYYE